MFARGNQAHDAVLRTLKNKYCSFLKLLRLYHVVNAAGP